MHDLNQTEGLYPKYRAIKVDSVKKANVPHDAVIKVHGIPMEEVTEEFFLLKFNDPNAQKALLAYADACEKGFPQLAADIRVKVEQTDRLDLLRKKLTELEENK